MLLISIDGLRPDAIERFGASTLQRFIKQGSYTLAASTITSKRLPSHTSMLTGVAGGNYAWPIASGATKHAVHRQH